MNTPISEHPTVRAHHQRAALQKTSEPLDAASLRQLCLDAGADDVGFVEVDHPALAEERPQIQRAFPHTRSLISIVLRMSRDNVRNPARSVANSEFHHTGDEVNDRWMTERIWVVSHKPVAVAAGMEGKATITGNRVRGEVTLNEPGDYAKVVKLTFDLPIVTDAPTAQAANPSASQ
jgi:hypothetical protein